MRTRSPLKWAGGKFKLLDRILEALPKGNRLVEPFMGSCVVCLNTDYSEYLLCDLNEDLISFFQAVAAEREPFIRLCSSYFCSANNNAEKYYQLRDRFNRLPMGEERAAIFLYLNRHGFNGLVRYNSKGEFNTPFGKYVTPYFPQKELQAVIKKTLSASVEFCVMDFRETFASLKESDVVYCDPPYIPISPTANFTSYAAEGFGHDEQHALALCAQHAGENGVPVILSNHDTDLSRDLYKGAEISSFEVRRFISCDGANRNNVQELLAVYS